MCICVHACMRMCVACTCINIHFAPVYVCVSLCVCVCVYEQLLMYVHKRLESVYALSLIHI